MADKTGWPPGLLQDDDRKLSRWFASRPGARRLVDQRCEEIRREVMADTTSAAPSERELFEAHARERGYRLDSSTGGSYLYGQAAIAWRAWQAARRAPQPVAREPLSDELLARKAHVGPVHDEFGVVTRRPIEYREELERQFCRGFRSAEKHYGITGDKA